MRNTCIHSLPVSRRNLGLSFFFVLWGFASFGQGCNCPAAGSCGTCSGGFTNLTLKFNGVSSSAISASDQMGVVFSDNVPAGGMFSFAGSLMNEKFVGPTITVRVNGVINTTISSLCGSVNIGDIFGSFTVVGASSKSGGVLCCSASSVDNLAPIISNCPANIAVLLSPTDCSQAVTWTAPTASDNCTLKSLASTHNSGDQFAPGVTTVIYTAVDMFDNAATCSFTVTVNDVTPPQFTGCPLDIVVAAGASCSAVVLWTAPTATDNCTATISADHTPGETFSVGITQVNYVATDGSGNSTTCSFRVTVEDTSPPILVDCPTDITITANSSCTVVASWTPPTVTDDCSVTLTSTHLPGSTFPFGVTGVTYTAADANGNSTSCSFQVEVKNSSAPIITGCPGTITVQADETGKAIVTWTEPQATVDCGNVTVSQTHTPGSEYAIGITTVTYTFTEAFGESSTCTFDVVVLEQDALFGVSQALTPDGDGFNDRWTLSNIENYRDNTVVVIDRWGNRVYSASGYDNNTVFWDGTSQSGTKVPTGTYFYAIEVRHQGRVISKKGFLEVIQ